MPVIAPNRHPEAETRLTEALSHLKKSGDDVHFIGYVEFLLSAGMLLAQLRLKPSKVTGWSACASTIRRRWTETMTCPYRILHPDWHDERDEVG